MVGRSVVWKKQLMENQNHCISNKGNAIFRIWIFDFFQRLRPRVHIFQTSCRLYQISFHYRIIRLLIHELPMNLEFEKRIDPTYEVIGNFNRLRLELRTCNVTKNHESILTISQFTSVMKSIKIQLSPTMELNQFKLKAFLERV